MSTNLRAQFDGRTVLVCDDTHLYSRIWLKRQSGMILTYQKDGDIWHEGILIGQDEYGKWVVLHLSPRFGVPVFETLETFAQGKQVVRKAVSCSEPSAQIVANAVLLFNEGRPYNLLSNNCQHFVDRACNCTRESWQVRGFFQGAGIMALAAFGVYVMASVGD